MYRYFFSPDDETQHNTRYDSKLTGEGEAFNGPAM